MQAPPIIGVLWEHLQQSRLLAAPRLAELQRELGSAADAEVAGQLVQRNLITQFQADRLLEGRSRGFFFDRYKILDLVGVGGMGWVYQAENTVTGEIVALKVLLDQYQNDSGMLARFQQEARVGMRLNHPQIVRTHRLGSAGGQPYVVMEFIRGPTLLEILSRCRQLPWPQACEFARQAALGLEYAHRNGLVHRDVKPQNLLLDETGRVRLLDFGLSMLREGEGGDEFSMAMIFGHQCVGTAEYMAPEQAVDSLAVDGRADVYSLGGTLFAALTGTLPFQARTSSEMIKAHRKEQPPSVREYVPTIPPEVAEIVAKMLAKEPDRRFKSAAELAETLSRWAQPAKITFDFAEILAERKQHAQQRLALLPKSRPTVPDLANETARPATVSSVAKSPPDATVTLRNAGSKGRSTDGSRSPTEATGDSTLSSSIAAVDRTAAVTAAALASNAVLTSLNTGRAIPLLQERVVVGRGDECDLQLVDHAVSGRHCELRFDGFQWWITDLASRNGTRVNGAPVVYHPLHSGDEILIGNQLRFRLNYDTPGAAEAHRAPNFILIVAAASVLLAAALILSATWWLLH